jgi:hypothetical protein
MSLFHLSLCICHYKTCIIDTNFTICWFCRCDILDGKNPDLLNTIPHTNMKSIQQILLLLVAAVACVSGFAPVTTPRAAKTLSMSKNTPEPVNGFVMDEKKTAAIAAFATAMAPFAAHAETAVDEATLIGYGAGLVASVVSLAVGFAIGYGTLAKL